MTTDDTKQKVLDTLARFYLEAEKIHRSRTPRLVSDIAVELGWREDLDEILKQTIQPKMFYVEETRKRVLEVLAPDKSEALATASVGPDHPSCRWLSGGYDVTYKVIGNRKQKS